MASVFGLDLIRSTTGLFRINIRRRAGSRGASSSGASRPDVSGNVDRLVQDEIIPRLLRSHAGDGWRGPARPAPLLAPQRGDNGRIHDTDVATRPRLAPFDAAAIRDFSDRALIGDADAIEARIEDYLQQGYAAETLFIDLIAPAARRIGVLWEEDRCDFIDVTMGLWRLQEVLRAVAARVPPAHGWAEGEYRALFSAMPGDQHSFGTLMVSECFQRGGWDCVALIEPGRREILDHLAGQSFDLVGLTVSQDCHIPLISNLISAMRSVSCNPRITIMIGGPVIDADPARALALGADATAPDAAAALELANRLVYAGGQRATRPL